MDLKLVMKSARSATLEIADGGIYRTTEPYFVRVNGEVVMETATVITTLFDLMPETEYTVAVEKKDGTKVAENSFVTEYEFVTLDVKAFGAKGDGIADDTKFIQAAILACPKDGRVLIPSGIYRITSIFLKSNLRLELAEGAELLAETDRSLYPKFPSMIESYDERNEYNLGTWEGNPLPMFSGIITGIEVENVLIYGKGTINGNASKENWWKNPKVMVGAFRPRLFFINHCKNVTLQGVKFCNSPSWTLHPYFSDDLKFYGLTIENPSDSPNTDGLDPESCKNVEIAGVRFSLGDDCIAVKSGKIYMGRKHKTPSENIHIRQCLMENGHGAVTIGSEMAGGVKNLVVEECLFSHTDRGLRIKTRRGRGKDAILDRIIFRKIRMDHVMTPFVANCFYFCDPDGKTEYVQTREAMPVDEGTPCVKRLEFVDIEAKNCHVAAAYFDGLPEQKIEEIVMKNVSVTYANNPKCDVPAMSSGVEACSRRGIFASNIGKLTLQNVSICGQDGEAIELHEVDEIIR
ncbi:MAG: glycoside hydrolase family 28 protein [Clostridiales bacterium]|nr:glycoside hydrolase family 28 protein [Roseburia sp.]MDD7635588.1 glycoside hydrolase family 28 protein [Clostridiales bacterium]MDY4111870.1 glycoside hydrolase family 28 protein [Roseburia sp.]